MLVVVSYGERYSVEPGIVAVVVAASLPFEGRALVLVAVAPSHFQAPSDALGLVDAYAWMRQ